MSRKIARGTYWALAVIVIVFGVSGYYFFVKHSNPSGETTYRCRDFRDQRQAQKLFLTDTKRYSYLDANRDGIACNGLSL